MTQPSGYEPPPGQPVGPAVPPPDRPPAPSQPPAPGVQIPAVWQPASGLRPPTVQQGPLLGYPRPPGYLPPPGYGPPGYPPYGGYGPSPVSPSGQPLSDFGTRLAAYVIDAAILAFAVGIVVFPLFFLFMSHAFARLADLDPATSSQNPIAFILPILAAEFGFFLFSLLCQYLYTVELLVRWNGQTPGKRIMKIRVIQIQPGVRLTRGVAAKRFLVTLAGAFVPLLPLLDGLWQLWDKPLRQCLHDKAAETVVVKISE